MGIVSVLQQDPLLEVVGEAGDGREAVLMVQSLEPQVVLMDVEMPGMGGLQATQVLRDRCPNTSVLILSMHDDEHVLHDAVMAGAAGYVLKTASGEHVCRAVRDAAAGIFSADRTKLEVAFRGQDTRESAAEPVDTVIAGGALSPREREVLSLVARGKSNREIAEVLVITTYTVKAHMDKLGVAGRTEAAVLGIELGYVSRTE
jgi:DNA-binding NarL/FixJ family response regulator